MSSSPSFAPTSRNRSSYSSALRSSAWPHHDAGQRPVPREHVDALAHHHGRVEATDRPDRGDAVVAEVRDDDADLVDVAHDRERRAFGRAGNAHPRAAEDVGRDLADRCGGLAPHGGGGMFLARRTGRGQQAFEQLGKGHGREDTTGAFRATPR